MNDAAAPTLRVTTHDGVAVLTVDAPPVNALSARVRQALKEAIGTALADDAVATIVLACAGRTFFAGADIREFGRPAVEPSLPSVVDAIEAGTKPVVAAIHGSALGGGLEIALGCHYRVALGSTKLGLPEVTLGLVPGAGGTQRLPRLVGVDAALRIAALGKPISAAMALESGLLDQVVEGEDLGALLDATVAFARGVVGRPVRRCRDLPVPAADRAIFAAFLSAHSRAFRGLDAPAAVVALIETAASQSFEHGVAREREAFLTLREGQQSKALRHVFTAERQSAKVAGLPAQRQPAPLRQAGIIGAGTMGSGIATAFLAAGFPVTLVETSPDALERGVATIRKTLDRAVQSGRLMPAAADAAQVGLHPSLTFEALGEADLIVEAAFETMAAKQDIFGRLDIVAAPHAILATNTSYLDVDAIAAATRRPEQVVGLHFFSPANVMKLLEIVRGAKTSDAVLASALDLARRLGKIPVVAGNAHGFIGNRMLAVRRREAEGMILEGASPYDVDRVIEAFGLPMGPFRIGDLAGLDLGWSAETSTGSTIREVLCERGRRGQKTAAGFYDYDADGRAKPSELVAQLIADFAARQGQTRRRIGDAEILDRLLWPMVDEGARILQERIAARASDIDVVWIHGYGWPRWTGGPMFHAEAAGLKRVVASLRALGRIPSPLLERLAESGVGFAAER